MPRRRGAATDAQDAVLQHQLDLLRLEAGQRRRALSTLLALQKELEARLRRQDLTAITKARLAELLSQARSTIDSYYSSMRDGMHDALLSVAQTSSSAAADAINGLHISLDASLPTEAYMARIASNALIMGAPSAEWWDRQSEDTAFRFANAVRTGVTAGEDNEQIVARVLGRRGYPGVMDVSAANARSLVHTSIQEVANEARMQTFKQNDDVVEAVQQISTLDGNTTDICIAYSDMQWTLDGDPIDDALPFDGGPPRHWGCRSVLVPVTKTFKELGIDAPEPEQGTRASADGPVPAGTTFEQFLSRRTEDEQDEQLGAGRAQMWRDGTITLPQLLDQRGNPMTLGELERKYE